MALKALPSWELAEDGQRRLVELDEGAEQLWLELEPRVNQPAPAVAPAGENGPEIPEIAGMCQENRHYAQFSIGGQEYIALLDPGANITGIPARVADKFPDRLESKEGWIGGAARGATRTTGELPLTITVDDTTDRIKAHVAPTFNNDIILGMDFMLKFDVDLRNGRYLWRAKEGPWHSSKLEEVDRKPLMYAKRMSPKMEEVARAEVSKLAAEGFIEQSASDWCSAPVLVKKQDGSYRFCIDYRDLNKVTVQDQYPIPNMDGILDKLRKARYLSKVDLKNVYHQIPMKANSKKYTAFAIPASGLWHYTRMPIGLCNAPQTFQRLSDLLFGPEFEPNIFGYLDDIIVGTDTFGEHFHSLKVVLSKLQEAGLSVNRKKCEFCCQRLTYLGFGLDAEGLRPDPERSNVSINSTMADGGPSDSHDSTCRCYMPDQPGLNQGETGAESPQTNAMGGTADQPGLDQGETEAGNAVRTFKSTRRGHEFCLSRLFDGNCLGFPMARLEFPKFSKLIGQTSVYYHPERLCTRGEAEVACSQRRSSPSPNPYLEPILTISSWINDGPVLAPTLPVLESMLDQYWLDT
ncbi:unnamed protein product [Trichogramma brassicae]|uniref:Reverse transcriptase domain-containing protein n=1 Tax=Trichogramma brassicae TaxID=86971 RepID=A0A6H5IQV0_9HYME|nr:unnamed protein product [Trichogramma brassicae]